MEIWILIERHPDPEYDLVTVWIADETRGPYKQYDQLQLKVPISLREFWLKFNSSNHRTGGPALFAWARNFVMLRNPANVLSLLQRPVK